MAEYHRCRRIIYGGKPAPSAQLQVRWLHLLTGTLLGLLLLWLSLKGVRLLAVTGTLAQADYRFVVLAVFTVLVTPLARAMRWRLLYYPDHRSLRLRKLYSVVVIGQLVSLAIPVRLGEVVRAYLIGEIEERSKVTALGTIIVEKAVDVLTLLVAFLVLVNLMTVPPWLHSPRISLIAATVGVLLVALVLSIGKGRSLIPPKRRLKFIPERILSMVAGYAGHLQSAVTALSHTSISLPVVGWSILIWFLSAFVNYLVFVALKLDLSFLAASFLLLVLQLGIAVLSSPGKVGVFHYLCVMALSVFSIERSLALSYAALLHLVVVLPPCLLGAFLAWRESLDLQIGERSVVDPLVGA